MVDVNNNIYNELINGSNYTIYYLDSDMNDETYNSHDKTVKNTKLNNGKNGKNNNIGKKIKTILQDLLLYVNNINIFNFTVKLFGNKIRIYIYVDFESKTLHSDLRDVYFKYDNYCIILKEYIYPLNDEYIPLLEKYRKIPSYIKLFGKNMKWYYVSHVIKKNFNYLSRRIRLSMVNYIIELGN